MEEEIRSIESLLEEETKFMNFEIENEFGKEYIRNFKEYYPLDAKCFFIKEEKEIVAFGILNPVVADYMDEKYHLFGIENVLTVKRGGSYGRKLMEVILKHIDENNKNGIGFCSKKNVGFYQKMGMKTIENLMKRFWYKDPENGEISSAGNGEGIFYGNGDFLNKILETSEPVYLNFKLW